MSETVISDNDCEDQLDNTLINDPTISTTSAEVATVLPDDVINQKIRSLNLKQRQMFSKVHKWARDYTKNLSCKTTKERLPFHIFLTGDGGAGKSHLVKTIYHAMHKLLLRHGGSPEKARILLLAPTGVAAININGTTIHSGLCIPCRGTCYPLNDKNRVSLRNKLSEVQMIIIDEISMVSSKLFLHINKRLIEIFSCTDNKPFAGKPVVLCGDLYQLPPVNARPIFIANNTYIEGILSVHLWRKFEITEPTEIMRQKGIPD